MMPPGAPQQQAMALSVEGVVLQPGERIVYIVRPDYSSSKTALLIIGLFLLVIGIGIIMLMRRSKIDQKNARLLVITTQRAIVVQGSGLVDEWRLGDIEGLDAIRYKSRSALDRLPRTDPRFWGLSTGLVVNAKSGVSTTVSCEDRPKDIWEYGFALAQVIARGSAEGMPFVRRGV